MKLRTIIFSSVILTALGLSFLTAAENAAPVPATKPAFVPADQPDLKMKRDGTPDKGFIGKHESFLKRGKEGPIGVLFVGDSITEGWGRAKDVWEKNYISWKGGVWIVSIRPRKYFETKGSQTKQRMGFNFPFPSIYDLL